MTIADGLAGASAEQAGRKVHAQLVAAIADKLTAQGLSAEHIGRIRSLKLDSKTYQAMHKSAEGDAVVTDLKAGGLSFSFSPSWDSGPEWPVVQPARPCVVRPARSGRAGTVPKAERFRTAVILPDAQIGYRRYEDGTLDPFHDESAMAVALQIIRHLAPDVIVNLGDFLDFGAFSAKFVTEPSFAQTTQAALDRAHRFLAECRANAPDAEMVLLEGNHDARAGRLIMANAAAAFGLRQANAPDSWPVMSVPHLLRLDELAVEYVGGFPAGQHWINDNLACIHGRVARSGNGATVRAVVDDERVSILQGHIHRHEVVYKTRHTRDGPKVSLVASPGTLARIDGAVPSTKGGIDPHGRPVRISEDWQNGIGVVTYEPGDGRFAYEPVFIHEGTAIFRGQRFEPAAGA